jgi:hypothetical protein
MLCNSHKEELVPKRLILITLISLVAMTTRAAELTLAADGRAAATIVISPAATESTKAVAAEFAAYLKRITGADFQTRATPPVANEAHILLGTLAEFPDDALAKPLETRNGYDGREAFAIRTDATRLRLIGSTDLGASHAAYRLLEHLGCRWFFPAAEWEVVPPASPTLKVSLDVTDRPVILSRRIWYGWGYFRDKADPERVVRDYKSWSRRNRMASSLPINAGHAWEDLILSNKKLFDEHPEYRALTKGKRQGWMLCVSNPAVRQLAVDYALKYFARNPKAEMASMECSDGGGHCDCDECKKLGGYSNQVFGLANHVARAVAAKHPGKMVGVLAYNEHSEPPTFDLEPNVYVQLTAGFTTGKYTFDELLDLWPKVCRNMGFYDYYSVWLWDFDRPPGGRGGNTDYIKKQIKRYADRRATSIDAESGNNWGPHGRGYYLANRLMWNPDADAAAILADFHDKAFGPAAAAMKRYYDRLDPGNKPLVSRHLFALAYRDLKEASELAKDRPDVLARLDHLKQYLRYEHLCQLRDRETDKAKKKELALAVITWTYRTRHAYMTHWEAMRQSGTPKYAKDFAEPTWAHDEKTTPKPWQDERPVTREETAAAFEEGLAYFTPETVEERTFSADLVPAKFPGLAAPAANTKSQQAYQGGARYALYSTAGEDLAATVTTGTIAWYRNRADARYTIRDAAENVIAEARLPLDGEKHAIAVKPPKPGLYYLDVDDSAAGWKIEADAAKPLTIVLRADKKLSHQGHMQEMFFYVPKGTKRIDYFWSGGPHNLHGPDGQRLAEITTTGQFVHVDVPKGADGQLWSFRQLALGHLYFFNCPNVIAASRAGLLLPREVVKGDRL